MEKEQQHIHPSEALETYRKLYCALILFFFLFSLPMSIFGQEKKFTFSFRNVPITHVYQFIERNSQYLFIFDTEEIQRIGLKDYQFSDASLLDILKKSLEGTGLTYEIQSTRVMIQRDYSAKQDDKITIRGQVKDSYDNALPGATVMIKGSTTGVTTDVQGCYSIFIPRNTKTTLVFSFVGMKPIEIVPQNTRELNVTLKENITSMDEVVVTGYQKMRKGDIVGSIATVKAEDIMMPAYSSIDQMLQGRVAGMMVVNSSSRVGTSPKIRIRGTSTILGNQDPLWVVDGVIQPDPLPIDHNNMMVDDLKNVIGNQISWLNPADIESISVLKDASATAIYGSKAANGVIVITTKRGKSDRLTVNYSTNISFRSRPHYGMFDLMNSQERVQFAREAFNAGAVYAEAPVPSLYSYEGIMQLLYDKKINQQEAENAITRLANTNTDWFDLLTRNSFSHSHNLSVSGGSEKMVYNASVGYNKQSGVEKGNNAENMSGRLNVGITLNPKLRVDVSLVGAIDKNDGYAAGVNPMQYATTTSRALPAVGADGNLLFQPVRTHYDMNGEDVFLNYNILNEMNHSYSENVTSRISAMLNLSWDVLPWLRYELVGGLNASDRSSELYAGEQTYYIASRYRGYNFDEVEFASPEYKAAFLPYGGELYNSNCNLTSWNIQNKLTFQKTFKDIHRVNVLLGTEVTSARTKDRGNTTFGYVRERGEVIIEPTPLNEIKPINGASPAYSKFGIFEKLYNEGGWNRVSQTANQFSVFATLAYTFKDRYVLNASMRNDASNRFGQDQNKRFDPTYSFGLSWNLAQEPWMEKLTDYLNQATLRASYGIQGNAVNSISPNLILSQAGVKNFYGDYISVISRIPNPNLSWERTKSWNFGLDLQLFRWVTMNFEYYTKSSNNLVNQDIGIENGRPSMVINGGKITNSGFEYTLNVTPIRTKNWGWTIGLNTSRNWNKAKIRTIDAVGLRDYLEGAPTKVLKEGYDLSSFWSFSFKGLNHETGQPEFNLIYQTNEDGSLKRDADGNLVLSDNIREISDYLVYSGKSEPDFTGGLTTRLRWKDLTFGANFALLLGGKKRLPSPFPNSNYISATDSNMSKELLNRWKKPGDEVHTQIPVLQNRLVNDYIPLPFGDRMSMYMMWNMSDARVVSSSFFRCQQMSLTWNMNEQWCAHVGVKSLSLNFIVNNVFVIADKKFRGFDPELGNSVQPKTYSFGVNIGF